jgi:hypothetical protein
MFLHLVDEYAFALNCRILIVQGTSVSKKETAQRQVNLKQIIFAFGCARIWHSKWVDNRPEGLEC